MAFRLEQIQVFLAVVESGSFTAVSEELVIPQPTVSRYIKQLEEELGLRVFERKQRKVVLTEFGKQFVPFALQIANSVEDAKLFAENLTTRPSGMLEIEVPIGLALILLQSFERAFSERYPDITLKFRTIGLNKWHWPLRGDIRLHPFPPKDENLVAQRFMTIRHDFYASKEFVEKYGPLVHPHQLEQLPCIVIQENQEISREWTYTEGQEEHTLHIQGSLIFDNSISGIAAARQSRGVVKTYDLLTELGFTDPLVPLFEGQYGQIMDVYAIYRSRDYQPSKERVFIDFLTRHFSCD